MGSDGTTERLPDLDYAFVADFAKVEPQGSLSVIGASFTRMVVSDVPIGVPVAVAGRVRVAEGSPGVALSVTYQGSGGSSPIVKVETLVSSGEAHAYVGRVGVLFAVNIVVPVMQTGPVDVNLELDGSHVRRLVFEVEKAS